MSSLLERVERATDRFEEELHTLIRLGEERAAIQFESFAKALHDLFLDLATVESDAQNSTTDIRALRAAFRSKVGERWFYRSRYNRRAFEKPLGYAGDYVMMDMIYRFQPSDDRLTRLFDLYFGQCVAAEAVRLRSRAVVKLILSNNERRPIRRILNLGCGPAFELPELMDSLPECQFILVDREPKALDHVRNGLRGTAGFDRVTYHELDLYRLLRASKQEVLETFGGPLDFIYSLGVMDYVPSKQFARLLTQVLNILARTGTACIGNFDPINPDRTYMEWVGDWCLWYRTRHELEQAARNACPDCCVEVGTEGPNGVNNLLVLERRV